MHCRIKRNRPTSEWLVGRGWWYQSSEGGTWWIIVRLFDTVPQHSQKVDDFEFESFKDPDLTFVVAVLMRLKLLDMHNPATMIA